MELLYDIITCMPIRYRDYERKEDTVLIEEKNGIWEWVKSRKWFLILMLPFWGMDLAVRAYGRGIGFYPIYYPGPNIFTLLYCILLIGIISQLKKKVAKVVYLVAFLISYIYCVTQFIYYSLTNFYFSFSLLQMAGEGSGYIWDTIIHTPVLVYVILAFILVVSVGIYHIGFCKSDSFFPEKNKIKGVLGVIVLFLALHLLAPFSLGLANKELKWNSFRNARNIYNTYSDANKCMRTSGLYEYLVRNFYVTYLKPKAKMTEEESDFLKLSYREEEKESNDYTGMFEGKNLIFLQLEGMDSWMLSEETTPCLYKLQDSSYVFSDHYSMYTGGGSTFNSEFAVNTGFTTPITYNENVYTLNRNEFPHSMAKMFKERGYQVNAFHMNTAEFYSRGINYKNWGYDAYYGLADLEDVDTSSEYYELDRAMLENETFYKAMFPKNQPFVDYIISYTPHTPFTAKKGVGKLLAEENKYSDDMDEEAVAKMEAKETDRMVEMLMDSLKKEGLYENTVLVVFADHYLYTLNDKSILDKYKYTKDNRINNTPFFIWSSDTVFEEFIKTNMQLHILPTVLNLFGFDYNPNWYVGRDIFEQESYGISFFTDQSWYDGSVYVTGNKVKDGEEIGEDELKKKNQFVLDMIRKNDLTLKYNYLKD